MAKKENDGKNSREIVAVEKMQESIEVAEKLYSDGMPYEIDRIENEIRFFQDQAGYSLLEMGKRFIRIKAHEDHGRFLKSIENCQMAPRSVQYAMAAAKKFSNAPSLVHLGNEKTRILTILEDTEIQGLDSGMEIAGMTLDDIDRMSVKELKEKLREERKTHQKAIDSREKAIKLKEQKINELDERLRYQQPPTKEQLAQVELDAFVSEYRAALLEAIAGMGKSVKLLLQVSEIENLNVQQFSEWLNQFDTEMQLLAGANQELTDFVDEPSLAKRSKRKV